MTSEEQAPPLGERDDHTPEAADFDEIYRAEFPYVWRTLRRLGVAAADLEDLAHDVFVVVHRRLDDYDSRRAIRPWLFGIAYRLASDDRRRARNREIPTDSIELPAPAPGADALMESDEQRRLVLLGLDTLSLEQRAAVILVDIDGESPGDVAVALDIPLPTVYSRLRVGRQRFAAAVRRATLRRGDT